MSISLQVNSKNCFLENTKSANVTEARNSGINTLKKENTNN